MGRVEWQQTYTGGVFWPLDPRPEDVVLEDIAHALALQCRFAGHCKAHYSVAQHSIEVGMLVGPHLVKEALFHDAAEAYLVDLPRPVKRSVKGYAEAERQVEMAIAARFGLLYPWPEEIRIADEIMLATEARDLMAPPPIPWNLSAEPRELPVAPWKPEFAEQVFLTLARIVLGFEGGL